MKAPAAPMPVLQPLCTHSLSSAFPGRVALEVTAESCVPHTASSAPCGSTWPIGQAVCRLL